MYFLKCGVFVVLPNVVFCYVNSGYRNGGNKEKRETAGKMERRVLKSSDDNGIKELACRDQRKGGMEEHCIGREGPQRNVVLDKKEKKKFKK